MSITELTVSISERREVNRSYFACLKASAVPSSPVSLMELQATGRLEETLIFTKETTGERDISRMPFSGRSTDLTEETNICSSFSCIVVRGTGTVCSAATETGIEVASVILVVNG